MLPTEILQKVEKPREGFYSTKVLGSDAFPVRVFLPHGYEPNYPYPLVVMLHGKGGDEEKIIKLAPKISRRNFICIGLRGTKSLTNQEFQQGFSWGMGHDQDACLEEYIFKAVEMARRQYHIHSERVFLAGFCEGASQAYRVGLSHPDKFAGVASLNGLIPQGCRILSRLNELRGKPVFHAHGLVNSVAPLGQAQRDQKLLVNGGMMVTSRTYPTNHRIHVDMLRDLNAWIVDWIVREDEI